MAEALKKNIIASSANPLIVSSKPIRKIKEFCKTRNLAFEVVPGDLGSSVKAVRKLVSCANPSSVLFIGQMPFLKWTLNTPEYGKRAAVSDLPYMLSENGAINVPVCRLPKNPNHAISHLCTMFGSPGCEESTKITLIYGLPAKADPRLIKMARLVLNRNPGNAKTALYRFAMRLLSEKDTGPPSTSVDRSNIQECMEAMMDAIQERIDSNPALSFGIACGIIGDVILKLKSKGLSVLAIPELPNPEAKGASEEIAHINSSAAIITLDMISPIHGSGVSLVQENGVRILSQDQIRMLHFEKYPLIWFEGCDSGSIEMATAVLRAGGAYVGNSTYSYRQPGKQDDDKVWTSPDVDILAMLAESRTLGEAHIKVLQGYLKELGNDAAGFIERIMNLESIVLDIREGDREKIKLMNRSQFWGNCQVPSRLYMAEKTG